MSDLRSWISISAYFCNDTLTSAQAFLLDKEAEVEVPLDSKIVPQRSPE
jgi:hypothetical protein